MKAKLKKAPAALTVRWHGRDEVELSCLCTFAVVQFARAPIAERCPRCGRAWR
jgi:hypothetical protein